MTTDSGELEFMQEEIEKLEDTIEAQAHAIDRLRTKVAENDAVIAALHAVIRDMYQGK